MRRRNYMAHSHTGTVDLGREDGPNGEETIYKINYTYDPPDDEHGTCASIELVPQNPAIELTQDEIDSLEMAVYEDLDLLDED